jgi:hypothetical protein
VTDPDNIVAFSAQAYKSIIIIKNFINNFQMRHHGKSFRGKLKREKGGGWLPEHACEFLSSSDWPLHFNDHERKEDISIDEISPSAEEMNEKHQRPNKPQMQWANQHNLEKNR